MEAKIHAVGAMRTERFVMAGPRNFRVVEGDGEKPL